MNKRFGKGGDVQTRFNPPAKKGKMKGGKTAQKNPVAAHLKKNKGSRKR